MWTATTGFRHGSKARRVRTGAACSEHGGVAAQGAIYPQVTDMTAPAPLRSSGHGDDVEVSNVTDMTAARCSVADRVRDACGAGAVLAKESRAAMRACPGDGCNRRGWHPTSYVTDMPGGPGTQKLRIWRHGVDAPVSLGRRSCRHGVRSKVRFPSGACYGHGVGARRLVFRGCACSGYDRSGAGRPACRGAQMLRTW